VPDYWWDGTAVQKLESDINLTNYYNKTQTDAKIDEKIGAISDALTAAASQPISVGGTKGAVTTAINAAAVTDGGGLNVSSGKLELKVDDISVEYTVTEI
jgi:hypothetical protein